VGGSGTNTGLISAQTPIILPTFQTILGAIGTLHIGGDVQGGSGNSSGEIITAGALSDATIDGSLIGGVVNQATALEQSGYIQAGHIGKLTIGVDVIAGNNTGNGAV